MQTDRIVYWYQKLAPIYDLLRNWIFPEIKKAQADFFSSLPESKSILIVGGGTGDFLPTPLNSQPDAQITFLDSSEKMIDKAKKHQNSYISFIHSKIEEYTPALKHDLLVLPFFLDHFNESELVEWSSILQEKVSPNGSIAILDYGEKSRDNIRVKLLEFTSTKLLGLNIQQIHFPTVFIQKLNGKSILKKSYFNGLLQAEIIQLAVNPNS